LCVCAWGYRPGRLVGMQRKRGRWVGRGVTACGVLRSVVGGGVPHAVVRWSAVQGSTVGCCVVWPGGGEVPCGVAGWWVGVVWWPAALRGVVLWGGVVACCVWWCGRRVRWRGGVGAAWSGEMGYVGGTVWCYVVWWGAVCVRRRSGVLRGGGVIGWYTWVLCGAVLWGAMW